MGSGKLVTKLGGKSNWKARSDGYDGLKFSAYIILGGSNIISNMTKHIEKRNKLTKPKH